MPEFDFEDGRGPVLAHKHKNGGGWVEDTAHADESAYVGPNARVYDKASVTGKARITGTSRVFEDAKVEENARVFGNVAIHGASTVTENAYVSGEARILGEATIAGNARILNRAYVSGIAYVKDGAMISGSASVGGAAQILDKASVGDDASVGGAAIIRGRASIEGGAFIGGGVHVSENATIGGNAQLGGNVRAYGNARLLDGNYSGGVIYEGSRIGYLLSELPQRTRRVEQQPKLMGVAERMEALQKQGEKINKPVEYKESEATERARHVREELEHVPHKSVGQWTVGDAYRRSALVLDEINKPSKQVRPEDLGESDASARSKLIENPDPFLRYLQRAVDACVKYVCEKVHVPTFPCDVELSKKRNILGHTKSQGFKSRITIAINKEGFLALSEREQAAVLIHEVCHGVVFHYGKPSQGDDLVNSHGPMWRATMKKCGMDPDDTLKGVV